MRSSPRTRAQLAAVVAAVLVMTGCAAATADRPVTSPTAPTFAIDADFPDPDLLKVGDGYVAYATNGPGFNIRMATSTDLRTWTPSSSDPLPTLPTWASPGKTWAPDVSEPTPGHFVMYFVAADTDAQLQCIGMATANDAAGPFVPDNAGPIVCPLDQGGAIDPATFVDTDGTRYLVFKNDGNCCGLDTWLQLAPLSADGASLEAAPVKLIKQTLSWEGSLVEAPTLLKHGSEYVLFYSANDYSGAQYSIGYATAHAVAGPFSKPSTPLLTTSSTGGRYIGPGGQDVVTAPDGSQRLVIHSWSEGMAYRGMSVLGLSWKNGVPIVALPNN